MLFLKRDNSHLPTQGIELCVDIIPENRDEDQMIARARVVRVTEGGIGIVFLG